MKISTYIVSKKYLYKWHVRILKQVPQCKILTLLLLYLLLFIFECNDYSIHPMVIRYEDVYFSQPRMGPVDLKLDLKAGRSD